jgi:hypothetical protein
MTVYARNINFILDTYNFRNRVFELLKNFNRHKVTRPQIPHSDCAIIAAG